MTITGVVQAGGKSTRMGRHPKALIELGGKRIIERIGEVLSAVLPDLLIVTNTPDLYAFLGLSMVPDVFSDHGSLGGIYSRLSAAKGTAFTVACDMPQELARATVPRFHDSASALDLAGAPLLGPQVQRAPSVVPVCI